MFDRKMFLTHLGSINGKADGNRVNLTEAPLPTAWDNADKYTNPGDVLPQWTDRAPPEKWKNYYALLNGTYVLRADMDPETRSSFKRPELQQPLTPKRAKYQGTAMPYEHLEDPDNEGWIIKTDRDGLQTRVKNTKYKGHDRIITVDPDGRVDDQIRYGTGWKTPEEVKDLESRGYNPYKYDYSKVPTHFNPDLQTFDQSSELRRATKAGQMNRQAEYERNMTDYEDSVRNKTDELFGTRMDALTRSNLRREREQEYRETLKKTRDSLRWNYPWSKESIDAKVKEYVDKSRPTVDPRELFPDEFTGPFVRPHPQIIKPDYKPSNDMPYLDRMSSSAGRKNSEFWA